MYQWIPASGGAIPSGAAENGREANGEALFVARANLNGGVHPGKVRGEFGAANIGFGGKEVKVTNYEVLMNPGNWASASGGQIPDGAVVFGHEEDGTPLFVARANIHGGVHPGKVRREFGGADIPFGGIEEQAVNPYEILVAN